MTKFSTAVTAFAGAAALVVAGCGQEKRPAPKIPSPPTQQQLIDTASNGVVAIKARTENGVSIGTGWVVGPREIITSDHVVRGAKNMKVRFKDGTVVPARIDGESVCNDRARLVLTEDVPKTTILPMADGSLLEPGSQLTLLHYGTSAVKRFGTEQMSVSPLTVSNPRVVNADLGLSFPRITDLVQLQGVVPAGASGGPVLTPSGEMAGMVFGGDNDQPQAYAISVAQIRQALSELRAGSRKDSIGVDLVSIREINLQSLFRHHPIYRSSVGREIERHLQRFGLHGMFVASVEENSPSAGKLIFGDMITRVNGVRIRSMRGFCGIAQSASPGEKLTIHGITIYSAGRLTLREWKVRVRLRG